MTTSETIFVNQLGFKCTSVKTFTSTAAGQFELIDATSGSMVFSGNTTALSFDESSGKNVATGDFSKVTTEGTYVIQMKDADVKSEAFTITEQPYTSIKQALLKNFYYQRCGMALTPEFAGQWSHDACHLSEARVYGTEHTVPQSGGWHDAGDFGKYVVPGAKAVADLLLAYEWFPDAFRDKIGIPNESGMPDLLEEVRYELDFLFKMQRADGAVYHKVTTAHFPPLDIMPEDDKGELIMLPISNTAAGTFAATMAMAARFYREHDNAFADRCAEAAKRAWSWLDQSALDTDFRNPEDIHTGEYGDSNWQDEIFWAAAELYKLTEDEVYLQAVEHVLANEAFSLCELGWADVGGYGTLTLLTMERAKLPSQLYDRLNGVWKKQADDYLTRSENDGFGISLLPDGYVWGSNMNVMNNAMHLITAAKLYDDDRYAKAAINHWHYLLGRNVVGYCYVSGFGTKPVMNLHHRPSVADGIVDPIPGTVSGGPNAGIQDEYAAMTLQGQAPAACFVDHIASYSTNEMTIYWNSPAVFVAAFAEQE